MKLKEEEEGKIVIKYAGNSSIYNMRECVIL